MARSKTQIQPIRASAAERAEWKAAANAAGLTISDYVRRSIQSAEVGRAPKGKARQTQPKKVRASGGDELTRQVLRCGNNLNQLARWANSQSDRVNAVRILSALTRIERDLDELLEHD